jgi:baseplate J-like protein
MNLEDLTIEEQQFKTAVTAAGIPVTRDEIKAEFKTIADASGFVQTNTSIFSPFWTLVTNLMIEPVYWLIAFMIRYVMPNAYVKTASGLYLDLLAYAYDITRKPAVTAEASLTFTRATLDTPESIETGTIVRTVTINGTQYRLTTTAAVEFPVDALEITVPAIAESSGADYNLGVGYYSILDTFIPGVTVTNGADYLIKPGADEESDEELRLRIRNQFTAVADWHTDAKYKAMIAEFAAIRIDYIYFDHDIPRGPGSADAFILFDVYAPIGDYLAGINDYVNNQGNHGHGDDLQIKAMPENLYDVSCNMIYSDTLSAEEKTALTAQITLFIECAFRKNSDFDDYLTKTWPYDYFAFSELSKELHTYFPDIISIAWLQADIVSSMDIARLQTLTINEVGA